MTIANEINKEIGAYEKGPFEDLTIEDALTIIAVYAAQMDPQDCENDVKRIAAIAENHPEFIKKTKGILARINTYANSMRAMDPLKAVETAADALNSEQKKTAFKLAVEVALPEKVLTAEKKAILDNIAAKLSVDREYAQQEIEKSVSRRPHER
jgi:hypothetical protein